MRNYPTIGIQIPDLLIPNPSINLTKWSVIACDQFTSQPEYWSKVREIVKHSPSTLNLILPEAFLGKPEESSIISAINQTMRNYIKDKVIVPTEGMVLVERTTSTGSRHGLVLALDLEIYDYHKDSTSLIRATEGTILERLPPRVRIRENAILELPHILVLIDDPELQVIESIWEQKMNLTSLYDFDLMLESGHLRGYLINDPRIENEIVEKLKRFIQPEYFKSKYQLSNDPAPILFAMGDGNHSLATAKVVWEKKKAGLPENHPLRYALVEIANIHDSGLVFEPIHRVLFGIKENILAEFATFFGQINVTECKSFLEMQSLVKNSDMQQHVIGLIKNNYFGILTIEKPTGHLPVGSIQAFLDDFMARIGTDGIDFIHGDEALLDISQKPGNFGFFLPAMQKNDLFKTVILEGALPRKTFSMGEARDKRFYLECRRIQGM
jgi:hypothetical protein